MANPGRRDFLGLHPSAAASGCGAANSAEWRWLQLWAKSTAKEVTEGECYSGSRLEIGNTMDLQWHDVDIQKRLRADGDMLKAAINLKSAMVMVIRHMLNRLIFMSQCVCLITKLQISDSQMRSPNWQVKLTKVSGQLQWYCFILVFYISPRESANLRTAHLLSRRKQALASSIGVQDVKICEDMWRTQQTRQVQRSCVTSSKIQSPFIPRGCHSLSC